MERKLRVSSYQDYIAVDEVLDNKIISTPFYLKKGDTNVIEYKDSEDMKWIKTEVYISASFGILCMKDIDSNSDFTGLEWESPFDELLNSKLIRFIQ